MKYSNLHSWHIDPQQAIEIQNNLREKIILSVSFPKIKRIAGVDVAFSDNQSFCAICMFESRTFLYSQRGRLRDEYPKLNLIETVSAKRIISFPYVPGLLTFREGPVILAAFRKLKTKPDLVLFDGQGICHPRRMGIATHLGIILNIPSIGCAKSHLYGIYSMPGEDKGDFSFIYSPRNNNSHMRDGGNTDEGLGAVLRTRQKIKPLFVSCGYKISLMPTIRMVFSITPKYRIPEPLRYAHQLAGHARLSI